MNIATILSVLRTWLTYWQPRRGGSTKNIIADSITTKLFPKLKNKLKIDDGWNYSIESDDFVETFEIKAPTNENQQYYWLLTYNVYLKKKE